MSKGLNNNKSKEVSRLKDSKETRKQVKSSLKKSNNSKLKETTDIQKN